MRIVQEKPAVNVWILGVETGKKECRGLKARLAIRRHGSWKYMASICKEGTACGEGALDLTDVIPA